MPKRNILKATLFLLAAISITEPLGSTNKGYLGTLTPEKEFLSQVRRLTFEGRRSGEGYFSPDGTQLVFQSERHTDNPFYQIYILNLTTGETQRISPGYGKTTCAFFRPGTDDILFSSTHHDPRWKEQQAEEFVLRESGLERRYTWDYSPQMEIYVTKSNGESQRITWAEGYDAEASYSPDGDWIAFSSTRSAYDRELSDQEIKQLEIDPSYFSEIYIMRADGSEQRRLTNTLGYDGGPFFFADGSRIVWRQFDVDGLIADLWTMQTNGSNKKQITDFSSMSWAPYPHPSGAYVLFSSNKLGFTNFEIFIVDSSGKKEPVRVTSTDGFDGLPVISPDGQTISWTSNRDGGHGQIYLAHWNHEYALDALAASPSRLVSTENNH